MQTAVKIPTESIMDRFPFTWGVLQDAMGMLDLTIDDVARYLHFDNIEEVEMPAHISKELAEEQLRIIKEAVVDICGRFTTATEVDCELIFTHNGFAGHDEVESFFGHEIELTSDEMERDCEFVDWEIEGI